MRFPRTATAIVGLLASLGLSALLWWQFGTAVLFLVVPFVPFLFRDRERPPRRKCPACGFTTRNESHEYCPRDGHRLDGGRE